MNEIGQIVGLTVCGLAVLSVLFGVIAGFRMDLPVRTPPAVAPSGRSELDQSPAWWDREYRALERKQIPRDAASHEEHHLVEHRTYLSATVRRHCTDCGIEIAPYEEGPHG